MELASPAPWGFACKFSVQHLFHLLSLCRTFHQMAEQMPKDLFRPICQKALRHLLPNNSAFRSFEEVTQNFRANRRTAQKPAKNLFHSASGCPHANRNKSRSMESSLMNPSVLKCKYSYFDQIFILSAVPSFVINQCLMLRYGGHHIKPAFGPGPLSVNQGGCNKSLTVRNNNNNNVLRVRGF